MTPLGPFDVIIVGAGSAGCVLASRLSANPALRVCLVEAGPEDRSALIDTPLGIAGLLRGRRYNWAYETTSQAALQGRRLYWPRGKTLGGSSSINAMVYMRGHPGDYDAGPRRAMRAGAGRTCCPSSWSTNGSSTVRVHCMARTARLTCMTCWTPIR